MTGESWYKYYVMSSRLARGQLVLLTVRGDDRGDLDSIGLFIHDLLRFYDMPVVFADRPAAIEFKLCNMRCRSEIKKLIHEGSKKGNPETAAVPLVWRVPSLALLALHAYLLPPSLYSLLSSCSINDLPTPPAISTLFRGVLLSISS